MVASFVPASLIEVLEDRVAPAALSPLFSFRSALHAGASHSAAYNSYVAALSKLGHYTPAVQKTASFHASGSGGSYTGGIGFFVPTSAYTNNLTVDFEHFGSVSTATAGTLTLSGGVVKTGVGSIDLSTLPTGASGGTLNLTTGGNLVNGVITYTGTPLSGSLSLGGTSINASTNFNVSGSGVSLTISSGTSLNKLGSGTLVLTNGGTFTGGIQLSAGTLSAATTGTLTLAADATVTPNSDGTFALAGGATLVIGSGVAHPLTVPSGSTLVVRVIGDTSSVQNLSGGGTLSFGPDQPIHAINFSLGSGIAHIIATGTGNSTATSSGSTGA